MSSRIYFGQQSISLREIGALWQQGHSEHICQWSPKAAGPVNQEFVKQLVRDLMWRSFIYPYRQSQVRK